MKLNPFSKSKEVAELKSQMHALMKQVSMQNMSAMDNFSPDWQQLSYGTPPPGVLVGKFQEALLRWIGTNMILYDKNSAEKCTNAYQQNSIVFSIINYILTCAASAKWKIYEVKDEKALSLFQAYTKVAPFDLKTKEYQMGALEEITQNHALDKFFTTPNDNQGFTQFFKSFLGFKLITGNGYIEGTPVPEDTSSPNAGLFQQFFVLPSQWVQIRFGNYYNPVQSYKFTYQQNRYLEVEPKNMLHSKFWNPEYLMGEYLYGFSPITACARPNKAMLEAFNAEVKAYQNNGAIGVLSPKSNETLLTPEERQLIDNKLQEKFSGTDNINKKMVTSVGMEWTNFGMSPVDLAIIQSLEFNADLICAAYAFPAPLLFTNNKNTTFNNVGNFRKILWINNIIPFLSDVSDELNRWLVGNYENTVGKKSKQKFYIAPDWKSVPELREDLSVLVKTVNSINGLTLRQQLRMLDLTPDDNAPNKELLDKIYVSKNLIPIELAGASVRVTEDKPITEENPT